MTPAEVLLRYQDFAARVDSKFSEITSRYPASFACAAGCHSCCKPGLTVGRLEAENITAYLRANPALREAALAAEAAAPFRGRRCSFLAPDGRCGIYEARPLVCRSHGAPLQYKEERGGEEALRLRDACHLNFKEEDLGALPADGVLNLDTLNTLLAVLSAQAFGKDSTRVPLRPSSLAFEKVSPQS